MVFYIQKHNLTPIPAYIMLHSISQFVHEFLHRNKYTSFYTETKLTELIIDVNDRLQFLHVAKLSPLLQLFRMLTSTEQNCPTDNQHQSCTLRTVPVTVIFFMKIPFNCNKEFLRNVGTNIPAYTASHLKSPRSSGTGRVNRSTVRHTTTS